MADQKVARDLEEDLEMLGRRAGHKGDPMGEDDSLSFLLEGGDSQNGARFPCQ